jgi:UTP--glucose-1-phosphate uridylyltransferase
MRVRKAVITAAGRNQRRLPLQSLVDREGRERSVLSLLIDEAVLAGAEEICLVTCPGDESIYRPAAGDQAGRLHFVEQTEPLGYGHAVWCARDFTGGDPFLHMVGDHLFVGRGGAACAAEIVKAAETEKCSVSAVQPTREGLLTRFGAVGGQKVHGSNMLYQVDTVLEKPTPTQAEQRLIVPGLRAGHYLCFFGVHVLTPAVMEILHELLAADPRQASLSSALQALARRERYLALELADRRYDLGAKYGLFAAQFALSLSGKDRDEVLSQMLEILAGRESGAGAES